MKIVEPSVEYLKQEDPITHVAKCGHICYASPSKGYEADEKFYNALISSNHVSVLRHESCYFIIKYSDELNYRPAYNIIKPYRHSPYVEIKEIPDLKHFTESILYVATNANFLLDHVGIRNELEAFKVTPEEFREECPELMRYTFCLTTQISTSRELNRTANIGITEMSTRYIKFGGKVEPSIVRPWWLEEEYANKYNETPHNLPINPKAEDYLDYCEEAFRNYNCLLVNYDMKPEDARGVLPLDTMTKVIYTMSMSQWRRIIDMRLNDSTGRAHGNCHVIIGMVKDELEKLGYKF